MLQTVKVALRISTATTAFDGEIQTLIDAAKADLALSGVKEVDTTDPLIARAVVTYCKANFGWDNAEAERLQKAYDMIKSHLTMAADYNGGDV